MLLHSSGAERGGAAPDFALQDPHGTTYRRDDVMGEAGLLVAFICNHCPYVIDIMPRLADDIPVLQEAGIGVVCINANDYATYPADAPDKMPAFTARFRIQVP